MDSAPTIVLDPYLLMEFPNATPEGDMQASRLAISNHLPPTDFLPEEYEKLSAAIAAREDVAQLSVNATEMSDLMPLRESLALHQVTTIAAARQHKCFFASNCDILSAIAATVLKPSQVLFGKEIFGENSRISAWLSPKK